MYKILNTIGDEYSPAAKEVLEQLGEVRYASLRQDELIEALRGIDIAVIGLGLVFTREVIESSSLKAIATATTGLDHVDLEAAKERGVEVVSLRGETEFLNTITGTAELAFLLALKLMRRAVPSFESVKRGEWQRDRFRGNNMAGNTLGVIGFGRLGRMMAHYGKSFGMEVLVHDPHVSVEGHEVASFDEVVERGDVVSVHVHLSEDTENMIDGGVLKKMKNSAYLINTSRGKIVNEDDLVAALLGGEIGGYGTDVLSGELDFKEGMFEGYPLVEYAKENDNCIVLPHTGGMTHESRDATDLFIAKKLRSTLL